MMTTRARPGISVIALDVFEQVLEACGRETAGRALEALHGPGPEVVVDRARAGLDRAPPRPAVHPHPAAQHPGAGGLAAPRPAVVGRDQLFEGAGGQLRLGRDVAELE